MQAKKVVLTKYSLKLLYVPCLERDVAARLFTNMESRQQSRPSTRTMKRSTSAPAMRPPSALGNEG